MWVRILYNADPEAERRGYRAGDRLEQVYEGQVDLPEDEIESLLILYGLFHSDWEDKGRAWESWRARRLGLGESQLPRDLVQGDVVVLAGASAWRATELHWERLDAVPEVLRAR